MRVISSNDNIAPLRREQVCMGGGVVTGLILQGSLSLYSCYMSNKLFQDIYNLFLEKKYVHQRFYHCIWDMKNTILTKRPHFPQKCSLLPRMPSFLFNRLEKEKRSIFYIQWVWFLQCNLHHIVVGIAIYGYNIIYIYI